MKGLTKLFTFVLAAASGAAAFLYLVVWMRRAALTFGDTSLVGATAISAFLGGMALGAWIWGRLADRRPRSSLMIFAGLALATGVYGVASLWILHGAEALYLFVCPPIAGHGVLLANARFVLISVFILPAAVLMGGLPLLLARRGLSENSETVGMRGRSLRVERDRRGLRRCYDDIRVAARGWFEVDGSAGRSGKRSGKRRRVLGGDALAPRCRAIECEGFSADFWLGW